MQYSLLFSFALSLISVASATPADSTGECLSTLPLLNPGFESGSIAPWKPHFDDFGAGGGENASASIKSPGHPGKNLLRVEWTRFVYGVFNISQQVVGLCAGQTYNVSFDFQFHKWDLSQHPDECHNTVELSGAEPLATTQFGPFGSGMWYHFNRSFNAQRTGPTNLTVTTTCATDPDEDSGPAWAAWYDGFAVEMIKA